MQDDLFNIFEEIPPEKRAELIRLAECPPRAAAQEFVFGGSNQDFLDHYLICRSCRRLADELILARSEAVEVLAAEPVLHSPPRNSFFDWLRKKAASAIVPLRTVHALFLDVLEKARDLPGWMHEIQIAELWHGLPVAGAGKELVKKDSYRLGEYDIEIEEARDQDLILIKVTDNVFGEGTIAVGISYWEDAVLKRSEELLFLSQVGETAFGAIAAPFIRLSQMESLELKRI